MEERADAQLAACLIVDNQGEVAISRFAQDKAKNAQVKRFAEQMVEDHGEMLKKLQQFTPGRQGQADRAAVPPADRPQTDRPAAAPPANRPQPGAAPDRPIARQGAQQRGGPINFVALKRELGEQCLQSARKELESKEGVEFDKCYIGMAIAKHMQAIDTMKVFKNHASSELAQVIDEGIRTADTHLTHAKEIMKQLEGQTASTARREQDKE
jgi:predicted outer membrane protein